VFSIKRLHVLMSRYKTALLCVSVVGNTLKETFVFIIIIIIIVISFMQGIYTYIPGTNYVPSEYSVAAILLLLSWCLYH